MEIELYDIFNDIYMKHGFDGVINHVALLLTYGEVKCIDKNTGLYCITTMGWSEDEDLICELNHFLSLFHSKHYIGYIIGGAFYYAKDKDDFVIKLVPKVKEGEQRE